MFKISVPSAGSSSAEALPAVPVLAEHACPVVSKAREVVACQIDVICAPELASAEGPLAVSIRRPGARAATDEWTTISDQRWATDVQARRQRECPRCRSW